MKRRPPRRTPIKSSAAADVYKRQIFLREAAGQEPAEVAAAARAAAEPEAGMKTKSVLLTLWKEW